MEPRFDPVDAGNRAEALAFRVAPDQAGTVETVERCLAEAEELALWRPVLIRAEGRAVGFAMYGLWADEGEGGRVWLDRFFIDRRYQGKGWAKAALPPLLERLRREYGRRETYLSVYGDNAPAIALYEALGFRPNGERDVNGEQVMVRP